MATRPGAADDGQRLPGGGRRDRDLQPRGGGDGGGLPYTITATLSPAGVLDNYTSRTRSGLHDHRRNGDLDDEGGEQDLWRGGPGAVTTGSPRTSWRPTA